MPVYMEWLVSTAYGYVKERFNTIELYRCLSNFEKKHTSNKRYLQLAFIKCANQLLSLSVLAVSLSRLLVVQKGWNEHLHSVRLIFLTGHGD